VDKEGNDAVNDLTYLVLRATELMKLRDPNLNARFYPGVNSDLYLRRLCEANIETKVPLLPSITTGRHSILTAREETLEQARDYGYRLRGPGKPWTVHGHTGAIMMNLTSALELTLYNGDTVTRDGDAHQPDTGDPLQFKSMDDFKTPSRNRRPGSFISPPPSTTSWARTHQDYYPTPSSRAFFEGPMEKGEDLIQGARRSTPRGGDHRLAIGRLPERHQRSGLHR